MDGLEYEIRCVRRAVNVNWNGDGWNVNANLVTNPNEWNAGHHVVSRNYSVSLAILRREFCFKSFLPSTKHATYLLESLREISKLFS